MYPRSCSSTGRQCVLESRPLPRALSAASPAPLRACRRVQRQGIPRPAPRSGIQTLLGVFSAFVASRFSPLCESPCTLRLCVIFSSLLPRTPNLCGARNVTWAILPRTSERAPAPFALTHAPIGASIALPLASARSLSSPSIPPRDTCDLPRHKSTAEFSFLSRFLSAKIFACASTDSGRLPAGPATKAPSTSKKTGVLSVWSSLRALKHRRAPRGLFLSFRMGCVPVLLPAGHSRPSEPALRAPVFPAKDTLAAATDSPSPGSPVAPIPDLPDSHASAAPQAG